METDALLDELLAYGAEDDAPESVEDEPTSEPETDTEAVPAKSPHAYWTPRVSDANLEILEFLGRFPGATAEALSVIQMRGENRLHPRGLRSVGGMLETLKKLRRLGMVSGYRDTKESYFSLTKAGIEHLAGAGYDTEHMQTLQGISKLRVAHYGAVAWVGALFHSPAGLLQESLGVAPVSMGALVTEQAMRAAFEPINMKMKRARKEGKDRTWGGYRKALLTNAMDLVAQGKIAEFDATDMHPELWTLGYEPMGEKNLRKPIHQPDLAVATPTHGNLLVEVELHPKTWDAYRATLTTLATELADPQAIYSQVVYFVPQGSGVEARLKRADSLLETGLIDRGKLRILTLKHRDGAPFKNTRSITI